MDRKSYIPRHILDLEGYVPGLQVNTGEFIKLNTNENPFPLPDAVLEEIKSFLGKNLFHLYPDPRSENLREELAKRYKKKKENVMIGNGSDEVLSIVFRTFLQKGDRILILEPSYSLYPVLAGALQVEVIRVPLGKDFVPDINSILDYAEKFQPRMAVITNPNAPTGIALSRKELLEICRHFPRPVLIDEAYVFFGGESVMFDAGSSDFPNLMVCSTFSKAFSGAGLRLGWIIAHEDWITELDKIRDSYNVNVFSQFAGSVILKHWEEFEKRWHSIIQTREWFSEKLKSTGFHTLPSRTNFVFTSPPDKNAKALYEYLFANKILVRYFSAYPEFLRISIGTQQQMEIVYETLRKMYS